MFSWWQKLGVRTRLKFVAATTVSAVVFGTLCCGYIWQQMVEIREANLKIYENLLIIKDFEEKLYGGNLLAMDIIVDQDSGQITSERRAILVELKQFRRDHSIRLLEAARDINAEALMNDALAAFDQILSSTEGAMKRIEDPNLRDKGLSSFDDEVDQKSQEGIDLARKIIELESEKFKKLTARLKQFDDYSLMSVFSQNAALLFFLAFIGFPVILAMVKALDEATKKLSKTSTAVSSTCNSLKTASEKVSASATEQASAVEETVSTLNEITAMLQRSVENAAHSAEKANISYLVSREGKETVQHMRVSMQDIEKTVQTMTDEITSIVRRMEGFLQIIDEISSKTQIINDIVFQTKLLSFNASVEAARAGEGGKGFAVVAEEVGSLASTSGQAAREISTLLTKSQTDVHRVIQDTKVQIERLLAQSSEKIKTGITTADRCDEILQEVVLNVSSVKTLMDDIASAAREEAEGVNNISSAMNQIDTVTHANSDMAHETQNYSNILADQAKVLTLVIREFDHLIKGQDHKRDDAQDEALQTSLKRSA